MEPFTIHCHAPRHFRHDRAVGTVRADGTKCRWSLSALLLGLVLFPWPIHGGEHAPRTRPNILVILADDLGYADVGFNGAMDIPTPNLDTLAKRGIRFTNGYASHPFCSPTRAGLLTGRYPQRFGHEANPIWNPRDPIAGMPITETTLPQVLSTAGYVTGCVGKWHLGAHPRFHPNQRGFDEFFGFLGGGHQYFSARGRGGEYGLPVERNGEPVEFNGYLTDVLGEESAAFINRHKQEPWFLYVAFNAPHTPLQTDKKYLSRVEAIPDRVRRDYAAVVRGLDDAVGTILKSLRDSGQEDNTLVWFLSDNGGPVGVTHCDNKPLRGAKGHVTEGGIRVPFLVSWPAKLPAGKDYAQPVVSLDIFATAVAAAGAKLPAEVALDGVDLLPFLIAEQSKPPHKRLFWRTGAGTRLAIRQGDWKWLREPNAKPQLYNLANDIGEKENLVTQNPDVAATLEKAALAWNAELMTPLFPGPAEVKAAQRAAQKAASEK